MYFTLVPYLFSARVSPSLNAGVRHGMIVPTTIITEMADRFFIFLTDMVLKIIILLHRGDNTPRGICVIPVSKTCELSGVQVVLNLGF
jgi:hypothetical protein